MERITKKDLQVKIDILRKNTKKDFFLNIQNSGYAMYEKTKSGGNENIFLCRTNKKELLRLINAYSIGFLDAQV